MADLASHPVGQPLGGGGVSFGTDGIRGRVGTVMTPALALQVGYWSGQVLPGDAPVLLGMDSRSSGPMLVAALEAGLAAAGRDVWTLGLCPTPAVARLVNQFQAAGGLMVSASTTPETTASSCLVLQGPSSAAISSRRSKLVCAVRCGQH